MTLHLEATSRGTVVKPTSPHSSQSNHCVISVGSGREAGELEPQVPVLIHLLLAVQPRGGHCSS